MFVVYKWSEYVFFLMPKMPFQIPEIAGNVRTIIPQRGSGADGQIYVGTSKSCILAGSLPVKFRFIVQVYDWMQLTLACQRKKNKPENVKYFVNVGNFTWIFPAISIIKCVR